MLWFVVSFWVRKIPFGDYWTGAGAAGRGPAVSILDCRMLMEFNMLRNLLFLRKLIQFIICIVVCYSIILSSSLIECMKKKWHGRCHTSRSNSKWEKKRFRILIWFWDLSILSADVHSEWVSMRHVRKTDVRRPFFSFAKHDHHPLPAVTWEFDAEIFGFLLFALSQHKEKFYFISKLSPFSFFVCPSSQILITWKLFNKRRVLLHELWAIGITEAFRMYEKLIENHMSRVCDWIRITFCSNWLLFL